MALINRRALRSFSTNKIRHAAMAFFMLTGRGANSFSNNQQGMRCTVPKLNNYIFLFGLDQAEGGGNHGITRGK